MKKLAHPDPAPRLRISRGERRPPSAPRRAAFAAFGLDDYEDASVSRSLDRSRMRCGVVGRGDYPDNVVRFTTLPLPRRRA